MVYVMFLSKDRVLIRFGLVWVFLARKGSGCPSEGKFLSKEKALVRFGLSWNSWSKMVQVAPVKEKSMNQIELSWGNGKSGFWVVCPWISIGSKKR